MTSRHAYPEPLDAIVLAGTDDNPRRMIQGQNKAFLEIGNTALVRRVVEALLEASSIGQIFVVGPEDRLRATLQDLPGPVIIVQQAGKMLSNAWLAIHASEARFAERQGRDDPQRPLFFISSDLPLISAEAVDDFVGRCAFQDSRAGLGHGMLAGVAEEASLLPFYAGDGNEGIIRPYVHLGNCRVRLANIYVGRPRILVHQEFLQTAFEHRKAEKWKNVLALTWRFLGQPGGLKAAWTSIRLQATLLASKRPGRLYGWLRRRNAVERIEGVCGTVLGGDIRMVITPYGGLSLDADNEDDFRALSEGFEEWSRIPPVQDTTNSGRDGYGSSDQFRVS